MTREELKTKLIEIRHQIHMYPETAMEEYKTSDYIAGIMEEIGCTVTRGLGGTGVVATLHAGTGEKMIGLRADIDALNITELNDIPYKSTIPGKMHGCGHDSHAASLIGAAMLLKENANFNGTVVFIFQPGEEPGVGAKAMIADGFFDRFPISEIYAQHNKPQIPFGHVEIAPGIAASSEDDFWITVKGLGGHASAPQNTKDPLVTAAEIVLALQTVISRNLDPLTAGTISCCNITTDGVMNAIPSNVTILGDCRTYDPKVQEVIERRMYTIVEHICKMNGCDFEFRYDHVFIPMVNDPACVEAAAKAVSNLYGADKVNAHAAPMSGSEDFAWFQRHVPGAYLMIGTKPANAITVYPQHNARYNFNDDAILLGSEIFAEIVRERLQG